MAAQRFVIVGGGIVGLATALKLLAKRPELDVTLLEKEARVGNHQSTHNSGVLHAGLYYKPGSRKARLAVQGIREMIRFCEEHGVAHEICGKLVVATDAEEVSRLRTLLERGQQNGLRDLQWLEAGAMREIEPHVAGVAAVRVPEEGIVDYRAVCDAMSLEIVRKGGRVELQSNVTRITPDGTGCKIGTTQKEYAADYLINCAGLHCDRVGMLAGENPEDRILPFRGEYYQLRSDRTHLVRNLIYPVPDPKFPFLGVHFTRMIHGGVEAGPNAVLALAREGYTKTRISLPDLTDALSFPGLWKFMAQYPRMCWDETLRSFSRRLFAQSLRKLVPEIEESDLTPGGAGVRAQAISPNGELVQDFRLVQRANALHLFNAPSPAATASLAIGGEIVELIFQSSSS
ncbi:MAG: L-2-hydroxyglutarate oxidase [Chthoniobacterales bacterium]